MTLQWWLSLTLGAGAIAGAFSLRRWSSNWPTEGVPPVAVRAASAARLILASAAAALLGLEVAAAARGLPAPAAYAMWLGCGLLSVPWLINLLVGLSLLIRLGNVNLGAQVSAYGHSGKLRGFGLTRLELELTAGRSVFLPYLALSGKPLTLTELSRSVQSRVVMRQADWSDAQLALLHQAAVLSPYRDVSAAVRVEREGADRAVVHISLIRPGCEAQVERCLRAVLDGPSSSVDSSSLAELLLSPGASGRRSDPFPRR